MDISAYLDRIGYTGSREATTANLRGLQRAHLLSVPFENLDIHLGRPVVLDEDALFDKLVARRRGGFCYELNGLFARLLEELGYRILRLSASSTNDDGSYAAEFDHLILQVHAPDDPETAWLVDVGWGDSPLEPLRMLEMGPQRQGRCVFRLQPETCYLALEEQTASGVWLKHYRFNLVPYPLEAFAGMCRYHQTSPDSMFTRKRLATLFLPGGRATLSGGRLILTRGSGPRGDAASPGANEKEERELSGEAEVRQVLQEVFGIDLD